LYALLDVGLSCFSVACALTVARTVILAQASSSRLGESIRSSPWFCSSISLRRRVLVLRDASSRSGENGSPKRALEETSGALYLCPRSGDFWSGQRVISLRREGLAQARAHRVPLLQISLRRLCLA